MGIPDSKEVIPLYNNTALALIEYEVLWTASWLRSVHKGHTRLSVPIIYKDPLLGQALLHPSLNS